MPGFEETRQEERKVKMETGISSIIEITTNKTSKETKPKLKFNLT